MNTATLTAPKPAAAIDEQKLHELLGRAIVDFGGADIAPLVVIGDRLGLFRRSPQPARSRPRTSPRRPGPPSATSASGSTRRPRRAT